MEETIQIFLYPEPSHAQLCRLLLNPFLSLRVPCYIHFQEEPPRAGLQAAKCKSHNQSPNQSVLDYCKPQGASIPIWSLPQDVRKRAQVNPTTSPLSSSPTSSSMLGLAITCQSPCLGQGCITHSETGFCTLPIHMCVLIHVSCVALCLKCSCMLYACILLHRVLHKHDVQDQPLRTGFQTPQC